MILITIKNYTVGWISMKSGADISTRVQTPLQPTHLFHQAIPTTALYCTVPLPLLYFRAG